MSNILFLASKSPSRALLLREAAIPFVTIEQNADEHACNWQAPLEKVVRDIARHKMAHVLLPAENTVTNRLFVLTADTLSEDSDGVIQGKPVDYDDAIKKIRSARSGSRLCTAYVLHVYTWDASTQSWQLSSEVERVVEARYRFNIPDIWIDRYLKHSVGLQASNAIAIEGYGTQFLESVHGSYSTIVGLPMYELREDLQAYGFFDR